MSDRTNCQQPACDPSHRHSERTYPGQGRLCLARGCHCPGMSYVSQSTIPSPLFTPGPLAGTLVAIEALHQHFTAGIPFPPADRDTVYHLREALEDFHNTVAGAFEEMPET